MAKEANMQQILPFLYLGNLFAAKNERLLLEYGITDVMNCTTEIRDAFPTKFSYHRIPAHDEMTFNLRIFFESATDTISNVKEKKGRILVHCLAGVSRSVSICVAYLIRYENFSFPLALEHVQSRRRIAHPNGNFISQLKQYEKELAKPSEIDEAGTK
mmetsp:Transcript_21617/g.35795  ORF Transcript_21617/g.35795 Transcript_21617/m.35795 type:complete len:158 (+) Transcript_21617:92-565(+)